jgi:hypothetical protein
MANWTESGNQLWATDKVGIGTTTPDPLSNWRLQRRGRSVQS